MSLVANMDGGASLSSIPELYATSPRISEMYLQDQSNSSSGVHDLSSDTSYGPEYGISPFADNFWRDIEHQVICRK